jgi:MoaA/NifB/PqqE/SkfB family radical SAM enzyme
MKTFAWDICLKCNYNCFYCSARSGELPEHPLNTILSAWQNIFNLYGKCKIHITGGEPFCYPEIKTVLEALSQKHCLHLTTNLSFDILPYLAGVSARNLEINASYHPQYDTLENFAKKVEALKTAGFKAEISMVLHPEFAKESLYYKDFFTARGINFTLTKFSGYSTKAQQAVLEAANGKETHKDNECNAGISYAIIAYNGNVRACSAQNLSLGNLFENTFKFSDKKVKCEDSVCILNERQY